MTPDITEAAARLRDICDHPRAMYDFAEEDDWARFTAAVLADIRTVLAAVEAGPQWQPISTAPRDGTWFIGIGFPYGNPENQRFTVIVHYETSPDGEMFLCSEFSLMSYVTHWLPLPAPPEQKDEANA